MGESGSGKSVTALAIMGLLDPPGRVTAARSGFEGRELLGLSEPELNRIRGKAWPWSSRIPSVSLNPGLPDRLADRGGDQAASGGRGRAEAERRAIDALALVNIREPRRVANSYPFEISGGMQQRAMIAMALSCHPAILIADEPTTALDVTTQAQILRELDALVADLDAGVILITHDLGIVSEFTDRAIVMYAGVICEAGPTSRIVTEPLHPYTQALLQAVREVEGEREAAAVGGEPLDPRDRPAGCPFAPRCPLVLPVCRATMPALVPRDGREVACHAVANEQVIRHELAAH